MQSWRATLIPVVALLGTFGVLLLFGFTIHTLTMFALVLAIGLLVDDAIVVAENVERIMDEEGQANRRGRHARRKSSSSCNRSVVKPSHQRLRRGDACCRSPAMSLLHINASDEGPVPADDATLPVSLALARSLREGGVGRGPVVVMVHGYKYAPGHPVHCPHETLFSLTPKHRDICPRAVSWPRHLGFGRHRQDRGVAISFGWPARRPFRVAYDQAARAGSAFARLLAEIRQVAPDRPVHAIAHSLGGRVVLDGISKSGAGALDLALLLAPAEIAGTAQRALDSPAGRTVDCLTVSTRENDIFDLIAMIGAGPSAFGARMIGCRGLRGDNCLTLRIDDTRTLEALRLAGYRIAPPSGRICHWSSYLRPGLFRFYRSILDGELRLPRLRQLLDGQGAVQHEVGTPIVGPIHI